MSANPSPTRMSAERLAEIPSRVQQAREVRIAAADEIRAETGAFVLHESVPASRPAYAAMVKFEFEYVRWANATLLALLSHIAALDADAKRLDAIERGEIDVESMGTTKVYVNAYSRTGDVHTTADGSSLRAVLDRAMADATPSPEDPSRD